MTTLIKTAKETTFLEPRKVSVCESVKQIFPLIFIVDETGF